MPPLRFRFSLRILLVFVALAALGCHWLTLPTRYAEEFCRAMSAGDYDRVESMFANDGQNGLNDGTIRFPRDWGTDRQIRAATVKLAPLTLDNLWYGDRHAFVYIPRGAEMLDFDWSMTIRATGRGLEVHFAMH